MRASEVRPVVEPVITAQGLELDDLSVRRAGTRQVLSITVDGDGPDGTGPTLDDIADCSKALSQVLDSSGVTGERPYVLQVSSRGVEAPLLKPAQWRRNRGRLVAVERRGDEPVTGRIQSVGAAGVTLLVDGNLTQLRYDDIASATVCIELNRPAPAGDVDPPPDGLTKEFPDGQ